MKAKVVNDMDAQRRQNGPGRQGQPILPRQPRRGANLRHDYGLRLIKAANVVLVTLPFALVWLLYYVHTVVIFPSIYCGAASY